MYIVIFDLRESNGHVVPMTNDDDSVEQFSTFEEAEEAVLNNILSEYFPVRYVEFE